MLRTRPKFVLISLLVIIAFCFSGSALLQAADQAKVENDQGIPERDQPVIVIDPQAVEDQLNTGETSEHVINVANDGDEGLVFSTDVEIIQDGPEMDRPGRALRSTRNGSPNRDVEGLFAIFQDQQAWGWYGDWVFGIVEEVEYDDYRNANDLVEVDLDDYDAIWMATGEQSANFVNNFNNNVERFEDFVASGGTMFIEQGWNGNHVGPTIGGCVDTRVPQEGRLAPGLGEGGEEANWLVDEMGWQQNQNFPGGSTLHCIYRIADLNNIEDCDWYQVIMVGANDGQPGVVVYEYGRGYVIVSGSPIGHQWHYHNINNEWGTCYEKMLEYLILLGSPAWIAWEPEEGEIDAGSDLDVIITLNAEGLYGGDYEADLHFFSNDGENDDVVVNVALEVIGAPDIVAEWDEGYGYPDVVDWNMAYADLFIGHPYDVPVTIINAGTDELNIASIEFAGEGADVYSADPGGDFEAIPAGEEMVVSVILNAAESGQYDATMVITSDDPDEEVYEVALTGIPGSPPVIIVDPQAIEDALNTGETSDHILNVANDGDAELRFEIDTEIINEPGVDRHGRTLRGVDGSFGPQRDDPGDVLARFNDPVGIANRYKGVIWDYDNEWLWLWHYTSPFQVQAFDIENFEIQAEWNAQFGTMNGVYYDGRFYTSSYNGGWYVHMFSPEGEMLGRVETQYATVLGVGVSREQELMFIQDYDGTRPIGVFEIDGEGLPGEQIAAIDGHMAMRQQIDGGNYDSRSICWVDKHPEGQLWFHTRNGGNGTQLWQFSVDGDWNPAFVQRFVAHQAGNGQVYEGFAHDGYNLWACNYAINEILCIDDGITEMYWLGVEPTEGAIAGGGDMDVFVTLNAAGLIEGLYEADMHFLSNDPDEQDVVVNVALDVTGASDIIVEWDEAYGYPDVADWNDAHPDLFNGGSYPIFFTISNVGTAELTFEAINFVGDGADVYRADPGEGWEALAPRGEMEIQVLLESDESGMHEATMVIVTNDPDQGEFGIALQGQTGEPPVFVVDPNAIEVNLVTGEIAEEVLSIANDGDAPLRFTTDAEIIQDGPEMDRPRRTLRSTRGLVPRRDDPVDLGDLQFAVFETNNGWNNGMYQGFLGCERRLNQENLASFRAAADWNNVDFDNYDVICVNAYNQPWANEYNNNLERFEEYIAGGGAAYFETANANQSVHSPGDIWNDIGQSSSNGILVVSPDPNADNYSLFAELARGAQPNNWDEGEIIEGSAWVHSGYSENQFIDKVEDGTLEWYQVIGVQQQNPNNPGAVAYGFGRGAVLTVAHPVGFGQVNHNTVGKWHSIVGEFLYYLVEVGGAQWLTWEPEEAEIEAGADLDVFVVLNAEGLYGGDYEADLHFFTNDPDAEDAVVNILMHVEGASDIDVEWPDEIGYPDVIDWNRAFVDLFWGGPYSIEVEVNNVGTDELAVADIACENGFFTADPTEFNLAAGDGQIVLFTFNADEAGDNNAEMIITSDDPDEAEYVVAMHAHGFDPPDIVIDPNAIEDELFTGEISEHVINVANDGDADLRFTVEHEILNEPGDDRYGRTLRGVNGSFGPQRDDPGDELARFNDPVGIVNRYKGVVWDYDNEWLWLWHYTSPFQVQAVDIENFEIQAEWNAQFGTMNGVYYEGRFYTSSYNGGWYVHMFSPEGEMLGRVETQYATVLGVGVSREQELMFIQDYDGTRPIGVFEIGDDGVPGEQIAAIDGHMAMRQQIDGGNYDSRSICWVDKHPEGQLWFHTRNGGNGTQLWQFSVDDDWNPAFVQRFVAHQAGNGQVYEGFAHDGYNLWACNYAITPIICVDDGIEETYWLGYEPTEGEIANGADMDIIVTLDATGLLEGLYEADLIFLSNDPDSPESTVSVTLNVIGAPDIVVEWAEGIGFPDVVDWNRAFEDVFWGGPYAIPITIMNEGTADLNIESILADNDYFSCDPVELVIPPREERDVSFIFNADEPGDNDAAMTITSDDPDAAEYVIALHAQSFNPPMIVVDPQAIEDALFTGETAEHVVNISNEGEADLRWEAEIEIIREPEADRSVRSLRSVGPSVVADVVNNAPRSDDIEALNQWAAENPVDPEPQPRIPYRDPPESRYLLLMENGPMNGWRWDLNLDFRTIEADYEQVRSPNDLDDIDLGDYDVVYVANYESDAWNTLYNQHIEQVEEFVDRGGAYYMCSGTNNWGVAPVHPGGLVRTQGGNENVGVTIPEQEENWLMEYLGWDPGHQSNGSSFNHAHYPVNSLENIENSDEYQVIFQTQGGQQPVVIVYNFGRGWCVVSGCTDGYLQQNFNRDGEWGQAMAQGAHLMYLDFLANFTAWVSVEPEEGLLRQGEDEDMIVMLNAEGLFGGEYEADIHILNNDPADPDVVVNVLLDVTGSPDIDVVWDEVLGYPDQFDFDEGFIELFTGGPYSLPITVRNVGTDDLVIEDVTSDNGYFTTDWNDEEQNIVVAGTAVTFNITLNADEDGDHEGVITITSNDEDEGEIGVAVLGRTLAAPIIVVDPQAVEDELVTGEISEHVINIANDGVADLRWWTDHEIIDEPGEDVRARNLRGVDGSVGPQRDDPGDELARFNDPVGIANRYKHPVWDYDNEWLWVSHYTSPYQMQAVDIEEFEIQAEWNAPFGFMSGAYYDGMFYMLGYNGGWYGWYFSPEGENLGRIETPLQTITGIAISRENEWLLLMDYDGVRPIAVHEIDDEGMMGEQIGTIENHQGVRQGIDAGNYYSRSMCWVDKHPDGQLWFNTRNGGNGNFAWQMFIDDDWNAEFVQRFLTHRAGNGQEWDGIAHDGYNFWCADYGNVPVLCIDDGITETYWLGWEPTEGRIAQGADQDMIVTLDATGLIGGDYIADLFIYSNDPSEPDDVPDVTVNVTLTVTGVPNVHVAPGGEEEDPLDFGIAYFGYPVCAEVVVFNVGTDDLEVTAVEPGDNPDFFVDEADLEGFVIIAGESAPLPVWYAPDPDRGGEQATTLLFTTNDPNYDGGYPVDVMGVGLDAPVLVVDPDRLTSGLEAGETEEQLINVANDGGSLLVWDTNLEILAEPEEEVGRDNNGRSLRSVAGPVSDATLRLTPRRDEPNELNILMLTTQDDGTYGWHNDNTWLEVFNDQDPEPTYANIQDVPDIDMSEFDLVGTGEDLNASVYQSFTQNREIFEEYVDGGGCFSFFTGSNSFQAVTLFSNDGDVPVVAGPGGDWGEVNDIFRDEDDATILIEGIEEDYPILTPFEFYNDDNNNQDRRRNVMRGNSLNYEVVLMNALPEEAVWYYRPQQSNDRVIIADWPFGSGYVLFTGITGTLFYRQDWQWSSMMECVNLTKWADWAGGTRWLSWEPRDGEIDEGADTDIIVTFDATDLIEGEYIADMHFLSNDPENPDQVVEILLQVGVIERRFYTDFVETENSHHLIVNEFLFDNEVAPRGWEIGVFTPDDVLSGSAVWMAGECVEFEAYGAADGVDQFVAGDAFTFKAWDDDADVEYTTIAVEFQDGPEVWVPNSVTELGLYGNSAKTLDVEIFRNWNMISINIIPPMEYWENEDGPDIKLMMEQLYYENDEGEMIQAVELMKDEDGNFYSPDWFDFCNIPFWHPEQGYQVKIRQVYPEESVIASWTGAPIDADAPITIDPGWHIIAYYPEYELDASRPDFYVVSPILDFVGLAKDAYGHFMVPAWNYSDMEPWCETQGYQIRIDSDEPVELVYPPEQEEVAFVTSKSKVETHWTAPVTTGANMSVLVSSVNGIQVADGDQIAAYNADDRLVGTGTIHDGLFGLAVWGDDPTTEAVDGLAAGEAFTLRLWDADREVELNLETGTILTGNGLVYGTDDFTVLEVSVQAAIPDEYYLSQNFPNPFNSITKLTYGLPEASIVTVRVYDVVGRLVTTLVSGDLEAGHHVAVWDAKESAAGVYLVRMEASGFTQVRKVMLVK